MEDDVRSMLMALNATEIDKILDEIEEREEKCTLQWEHICNAMSHWLYNKLSIHLKEIIDKHNIQNNDLCDKTIKNVLNDLKESKNISLQQIEFMDKLIRKAIQCNPFSLTDNNNNNNQQQLNEKKELDFDTNGLIYWLGTNGGKSTWKNPALRGNIRVYSSSLGHNSEPNYYVVGDKAVRCFTDNYQNSWFMIDLLNVKAKPTSYSLRHYPSQNTNCLRNWILEASNNSTNGFDGTWNVLSTHIDDQSLYGKGSTHNWSIQKTNKMYSQFRILQTGQNSAHQYYLVLSGFEIYGTAYMETNDVDDNYNDNYSDIDIDIKENEEKSCIYNHDFDENGLLYYLGTSGKTQTKYCNPVDIEMVYVLSSTPLHFYSQPLSYLVGRELTNCYTQSRDKNTWIKLQLKNIKIKLTHYTLRHSNSSAYILRSWNLDGSNNGVEWKMIKVVWELNKLNLYTLYTLYTIFLVST